MAQEPKRSAISPYRPVTKLEVELELVPRSSVFTMVTVRYTHGLISLGKRTTVKIELYVVGIFQFIILRRNLFISKFSVYVR